MILNLPYIIVIFIIALMWVCDFSFTKMAHNFMLFVSLCHRCFPYFLQIPKRNRNQIIFMNSDGRLMHVPNGFLMHLITLRHDSDSGFLYWFLLAEFIQIDSFRQIFYRKLCFTHQRQKQIVKN